ncbi:hypothetical protein C0J52_13325 [Blattella germanica]|nr:hypothetical protein C0J52_13325 [Blattella germanica]
MWMKTVQQGTEGPAHICTKCGKVYSWKANLGRHMRLECGKIPHLQCPHCSYVTNRKSSLDRHILKKHEIVWNQNLNNY